MKRIIFILFIFILILVLSFPSIALSKQDDIFYYIGDTSKVQSAIKNTEKERIEYDLEFIKNFYLNESEEPDVNKLYYDLEHIYTWYEWDYDSVIEFIKTENKYDFLKKMPVKSLWFSFYYNGQRIEKRKASLINQNGTYFLSGGMGIVLSNKEEIADILEAEGITGYEILQSVTIDGINYAIAQNEEETVAIYVPVKDYLTEDYSNYESIVDPETKNIYKNFEQQFKNRIFSISDLEQMSEYTIKNADIKTNADPIIKNVGNELNDTTSFPWKYVGIGAGALVLSGVLALVLVLILKKKKAA